MATLREKPSKELKSKLLKILTYEKVNGKPIYYRDYRKVLKGELPPEAVMGSSELQALIIRLIVGFLLENLDMKKYEVLFNEIGFKTPEGNLRALDIAVFKRDKLKKILPRYTTVVPEVIVEVDTKADVSKYGNLEAYVYEKTQELLNAGVRKVIWIITQPKKVLLAESKKKWILQDVDEDIDIIENIKLNIVKLFKERGYQLW